MQQWERIVNQSISGVSWVLRGDFPGIVDGVINLGGSRALKTSDTVCDLSLGLGSFALPTFENSKRAPLSDCPMVQAKDITRKSMFPNKALLPSAHNHLNNIYLMVCISAQGVQLHGSPPSSHKKNIHLSGMNCCLPTLMSNGNVPFLSFNSLSSLFLEPFLSKRKNVNLIYHESHYIYTETILQWCQYVLHQGSKIKLLLFLLPFILPEMKSI